MRVYGNLFASTDTAEKVQVNHIYSIYSIQMQSD